MVTIVVSTEEHTLRNLNEAELREILATDLHADQTVWVDLQNPTEQEEDLYLKEIFHFHPLAILDCRRERISPNRGDHLPKVEDYGSYLFSIINPIELVGPEGETAGPGVEVSEMSLETRQLNVFLGARYIVTHHYEPSGAISQALASCSKNPKIVGRGPDYLYHIMLDDIVDQFTPILDAYDDVIDRLEDEIFDNPTRDTLLKILNMKRQIFRLRRITTYQREMVFRLSRGEYALISEQEIAYYRNVFDHLVRAADLTESYRDVLTGMLDAYLSMASNKMNEIVKVLTIISTFFLPLTFIAGVYGMNFVHMPELHWRYGYLFVWGLMIGVSVVMYIYFRKRRWL